MNSSSTTGGIETPENLTVSSGDNPFLVERAYDGIEHRVLCFDDEKMQVDYTIDADAVFPEQRRHARPSTSSATLSG